METIPRTSGSGFTFVDLFCGAGGLSEGFRQAGLTAVAGSDIDPDAIATYAYNFPDASALHGDLRDRNLRRRLLRRSQEIDVVAGGPPCQGFSQVRNHSRLIDDPKNALYREFVSIVQAIQPRAFVMENVPGMAQMGVLKQVLDDLACRGNYRVAAEVVDAADFGVPQSRKRIVFIGVHSDLGADAPPLLGSGAHGSLSLRRMYRRRVKYEVVGSSGLSGESFLGRLEDPWDDSIVSARQAIGDLTGLRAATNRVDALPVTALGQPSSTYQKVLREGLGTEITNVGVPRINDDTRMRLEAIPPGGNHLDLPELLQGRYLTGKKWGPHNGSQRLSRRHYYAYRRLHPDIWSWTLNTKADSVYHWASPRGLSVREFARLQSFPDAFEFISDVRRGPLPGRIEGGPGHARYRQVGNAVPPILARAVAESLLSVLTTG